MTNPESRLNKQQKQILFLLYKFRFLTINQLLKYFNHKYPSRIRTWLKELVELKYISEVVDDSDPTKFHIFCLNTKAKYILQKDEEIDKEFLGRLYKEKKIKDKFRNHCLFILDIYLYFLSQLEKGAILHFLTRQDLIGYDFFPEELPDAYIAIETKEGTEKYFLDLFDEYRNYTGVIRFTVRKYLDYNMGGSWQANTQNSQFPSILFVMPNESRKKFAFMYGRAKLAKSYENISLFTTTQDYIRFAKDKTNIWTEVV